MRTPIRGIMMVVLMFAASAVCASVAQADQAWWHVQSNVFPAVLAPGHTGEITMIAADLGDAAVTGKTSEVVLTDDLPAGIKATEVVSTIGGVDGTRGAVTCTVAETEVRCGWAGPEPLQAYEQIEVVIGVEAESTASPGENRVSVSGGEAYICKEVAAGSGSFGRPYCAPSEESPGSGDFEAQTGPPPAPMSIAKTVRVGQETLPFGLEEYEMTAETEGGGAAERAGSHPLQVTTSIAFDQGETPGEPSVLPRDLTFNWPAGLIGDPTSLPQCTSYQFATTGERQTDLCPADTAVGVASVDIALEGSPPTDKVVPVFNLTPERGEPARLGFMVSRVPVTIDTALRTGSDYGIVASIHNLSQLPGYVYSRVTIWGTPAAAVHDNSRGWNCLGEEAACSPLQDPSPSAFLRMPTSCEGPLQSTALGYSWPTTPPGEESLSFGPIPGALAGMSSCESVPFTAQIATEPEAHSTSTPTGLLVKVHVPQATSENPNGIAESDLRDTTVTLPEGITLNPSAANGLEACSETQAGFTGEQNETQQFTAAAIACPAASKLATVKIVTPILPNPLSGSLYLATPAPNSEGGQNPFNSLIAVYLTAVDPVSGVRIKLAGEASLNPVTGRIQATFKNTPQDPFEELEISFFGGEQAALATPARCAPTGTTTATFTPWSGLAPLATSASFPTTTGPGGGACPGTLPFNPTFTAGTTSTQAGTYSPFALTFARQDGEQDLNSIEQTLPPGLLAKLAGVPLCGEAQANEGSCPAASQIGTVTVAAGVGSEPLYVSGTIYLTGPYNNGPFGIAVEVPAIAGPFNLDENGRPVVVLGSIRINPTTAQATVVSNAFPTILKGIPLQVRTVNVTLNRPGFTFNPTSCTTQKITAAISSTENTSAGVSSPFGAVNCATLPFKPSFTAGTAGHASKAEGASLVVKIASKGGPGTSGEEANIRAVKVDLPKQLPSRLTTLQKACTEAKFNANPASCPEESDVGTATASTPVLANPLIGPAYLVSHGNEAFPDLEIVLQGEGVTLVLDGNTLIKKGITSSTFKTVPDAPISSFELKLPVGKFSILGTNLPQSAHYNLCGQTLNMPTAITGQNGVEIHDTTKIGITGCAKAKTLTRAQKLTKALKACKRDRKSSKRASCERSSREKYGPIEKKQVKKK